MSSTRSSLTVRVNATGAATGTVYVAAYVSGRAYIGDASLLYESPYHASFVRGETVTITVAAMLPATAYDLYCAAASALGTLMATASTRATKQQHATGCCKTLTVIGLQASNAQVGYNVLHAVAVAVDAAPSVELSVLLEFRSTKTTPNNGVQLLPSAVKLGNSSVPQSFQYVQALALNAGSYELFATLSGASASEYGLAYAGTRTVEVLRADSTPAVPQLLAAVFSSDGSYVSLSFDSVTDRGGMYGTFPCRVQVSFDGDTNANCQWPSASELRVYPGSSSFERNWSAGLSVNSSVSLWGGLVRASCSRTIAECREYSAVPTTQVKVMPPLRPVVPHVTMLMSTTISACSALLLDISSSEGS
jgi:hypothetical protein